MLKVYFAINESGVNYWRGKIPAWELKRRNLCDVKMFNIYDYSQAQVEQEMGEADVIYMPCAAGMEALLEITAHIRNKKAVVVDYDDNLFDCHPYNPGYATLGLYPVTVNNSDGTVVELWKDQRHGFSLPDNRKRYYAHIDILHTANQVTTTTEKLKSALLEYVERDTRYFNIIPNSINFDIYKPFEKRIHSRDKIRIGWTASDSHIVEGRYIMRVLNELKKRRSDFEFVILGNVEKLRWVEKESGFNVEWHEFTDINVYPLKLASLEFDIGIVPLENHSFNLCKSALKWSEYSAMKIPSVVSNLAPYDCVNDGIDGLKAKSEIDMADKIEALMNDSILRNKIATNAYERNRADFNIEHTCLKWLDVFERAHLLPHQVMYKGEPLKTLDNRELILSGQPMNVHRDLNGKR
jgi:glycosyltransferase involved in cell wall biosynthesis